MMAHITAQFTRILLFIFLLSTFPANADPAQRPYNGKYYGMLSGGDLHTNLLFKQERITSARFRAEKTGDLIGVRFQARHDGPGNVEPEPDAPRPGGHHSVGDGGLLVLSLRKNKNGLPDLTDNGLLAITQVNNGLLQPPLTSRDEDDLWLFSSTANIVKGELYHIVFTNTHPTDYMSLNGHKPYVFLLQDNAGPYFKDDYTVLQKRGSNDWRDHHLLPWINYHYADGSVTGVGENWLDKSAVHTISGSKMARMKFTPTNYGYTASAVVFRTFASTSAGSMQIKLKRADNGYEIWSNRMTVSGYISMPFGTQRGRAIAHATGG